MLEVFGWFLISLVMWKYEEVYIMGDQVGGEMSNGSLSFWETLNSLTVNGLTDNIKMHIILILICCIC